MAVAPAVGWQQFAKQDADRFDAKLKKIVAFGNEKRAKPATQTTPVTDVEVNAYFEHSAKEQIPTGIVDPRLNALGDGRVSGQAVVDLDAVRKQKQRGWLDPMSYLTGSVPVTASGLLITKDGVGRFQLESAQVSGISVPKSLLQELLGTTRERRRTLTASSWTIPSSCRRASARSASSEDRPPSCSEGGCMLSTAWTTSPPRCST